MGVFSRFKDIVNANINALLDKAEDPEKMLKLMTQEMEDTLIELKSSCAARMASSIRLSKRIEEQKELVNRWQSRARMAIERQRDDLAREALLEKRKESGTLSALEKEKRGYEEMIAQSRKEIEELEKKLEETRDRLHLLQEKARLAKQAGQVAGHMNSNTRQHFENLEERIDRMNCETELNRHAKSTDEMFSSLEEQEDIERELEDLKRKAAR